MINKTLHLHWLFDSEPLFLATAIRAWTDALPGWEVVVIRGIPDNVPTVILDLITNEDIPSPFRGDLFRYWYMYKYGGVYVDFDTLPGKSMEELLLHDLVLLKTSFYGSTTTFIDNSLMASTPYHPFWRKTIENALTPSKWVKSMYWFCGFNCFPDARAYGAYIVEGGAEEVPPERAQVFVNTPHLEYASPDHYFTHYRASGALGLKGISTKNNPTWLDVFGVYPPLPDMNKILGE